MMIRELLGYAAGALIGRYGDAMMVTHRSDRTTRAPLDVFADTDSADVPPPIDGVPISFTVRIEP